MITQILAKVLPVLVMIILGRVCATKGILNGEQHAGLKNVIGDILLPVVLFQAFFTADYGKRMLLVFVLVFVGYGAALAAGYALRRFVKPYGRFMPLLMTNAEGGMLGYALYALLCGADQTKMYAMVDIGQTVFGFTVFLTALKAAGGEKMTPKFIVKNMLTNKACIGMLLGIILGALGVHQGHRRHGGGGDRDLPAELYHRADLRADSDRHGLSAACQQEAPASGAHDDGPASRRAGGRLRGGFGHSVCHHSV